MFKWKWPATAAFMAVITSSCIAATTSVAQLSTQLKGTTVTISGQVSGWRDSWKPTAPNTFYLQDASGSVRTCIWPNQLANTPPNVVSALKKPGSSLSLTGEVDVFQNKVEIHVSNGALIELAPRQSVDFVTSVTQPLATPR